MRRRTDAGFTMTEVLVALLVSTIALAGTVALYRVTSYGNRTARAVENGVLVAEQLMEQLRGQTVAAVEAGQGAQPAVVEGGVTYNRNYTATTPFPTNPNLVRVQVTVTYSLDNSSVAADVKTISLELLRSRVEQM